MPNYKKLVLKEVKRETPTSVSILFNVPEEFQDHYKFTAGQYVNLRLTLDGQEIRRAYSICSSPESGELRIAVKAIKNGVFSQFANTKLKAGDVIEVGKPEGNFTYLPQANAQKNYAAFVAGSGITPVMSILKSVLVSEPQSTFVLVYGNKSQDETLFYQELQDLHNQYVGRLFVHYTYSVSSHKDSFEGRIDSQIVNTILNQKHASLVFDRFYLCGPEAMIQVVTQSLKANAIAEDAIKFELFVASSTETEIAKSLEGNTQVTIMVDDEETTFEMSQKVSILDAALKQGIDAPYSCQGGICSSCMARIKEGSAEMKKNSILTEKEIADGLILTCQAHPTSAVLVVDFDDV